MSTGLELRLDVQVNHAVATGLEYRRAARSRTLD